MKTKTAVAILLVAIFALSSIATITIRPAKASGTLMLSDTELYNEFAWKYDPNSSLTLKTDVPGSGVRFDIAGLGKAGIEDIFPVSSSASGALYYGHYSDFNGYDKYSMLFINVGSGTIQVSLYMNTGFTNSGDWGYRDWHYDTFWKSNTITLGPHESGVLTLDFLNVYEAWNIADDPVYTGYSNGVQPPNTAIFRLNEVTSLGFEVLGSGSASVIASGTLTHLYIDPPEQSAAVNSFFDVYVTLSDFSNLAGFDIKLTWDSTLITETAHDYASYLDTLWGAGKWQPVNETSGAGYYKLAAAALATSASNPGAAILFHKQFKVLKGCNFLLPAVIHFDTAKLSDNTTPIPNPIPATVTDGTCYITATKPDLEFKVLKWNPKATPPAYEPVTLPDHFEYCNLFEVQVYVTDIHDCSPLKDYDITIDFVPGLAVYHDMDVWGIFGAGSVNNSTEGIIHVQGSSSSGWYGDEGLLFTMTFHVEFTCIPDHIWKKGNANFATFQVWLADASLSFGSLGTIPKSGIITPSTLTFEVDFIRGDMDCNGAVTIADISSVAYYYDHPAGDRPEYDLTNDGTIDIYDIVAIATNYGYPT